MKFVTLLSLLTLQPWNMFAQSPVNGQKFVCNTGYTLQQCQRQMKVLRPVLDKFHAETVGEWTWILVRSQDWRSLMYRLGANPDSPALSFLGKRTTVLEEALVEPSSDGRAELLRVWGLPINQLLDKAVSHELGHSLCNDPDESRAERRAQALQHGETPQCGSTKPNLKLPGPAAALRP